MSWAWQIILFFLHEIILIFIQHEVNFVVTGGAVAWHI